MRATQLISRTLVGWLLSFAFSIGGLAMMPSFVSAQNCNYGSCTDYDSGSCPNFCGRYPQQQDTYYDPECYQYNPGSVCYQYICWYLDQSSGTCGPWPNDVCDNDDYFTCQFMN
jgi:hypothetical protein